VFVKGLFLGATYPLRALGLFRKKPELLTYIAVPMGINLVLGISLYLGIVLPGWTWIGEVFANWSVTWDGWIARLPSQLSFLDYLAVGLAWVVRVGLTVGLFVLVGVLLAQFGTLLGAPWYGKLSEKIEQLQTQQLQIIEVGVVRDVTRALLFELKKIGLVLLIGLPCFVMGFIPVLSSTVVPVGWATLALTLVCLDFLDAPLERRRLKFRQKLGIIYRNIPTTLSFGAVCLVMMSLPIFNLVFVPICVASGTLLFCDRIWPKLSQDKAISTM
jgi:CysZ protein